MTRQQQIAEYRRLRAQWAALPINDGSFRDACAVSFEDDYGYKPKTANDWLEGARLALCHSQWFMESEALWNY